MSNSLYHKTRREYVDNLKWLWMHRSLLSESHLNAVINRVDKSVHGLVDDINMIKYIRRQYDESYDLICGLDSLQNKINEIENSKTLRKSIREMNRHEQCSNVDEHKNEIRVPVNQWWNCHD